MPASEEGDIIVAYTVVAITDVTKKKTSNKISVFPIMANFCLSIYFPSQLYSLK
jgi:Flp pilus assembly protein protease CpaA